jgi:hypothetical protein
MSPDPPGADSADLLEQPLADLDRALRGASLCSVSRGPQQGLRDVKVKDRRWNAISAVARALDNGRPPADALAEVAASQASGPAGQAWVSYRAGVDSGLAELRQRWRLESPAEGSTD